MDELIRLENIDINVEASDWEDAIRKAGKLLVDADYAEEQYVDGMVNVVKDYGPYIVILPGVALAHARPQCGAKKIGLSLITLKEPVAFGNETFDPVKLVFALCATDNHSHLDLLQEIAIIFEDEKKMLELADCETNEELINTIYARIAEASQK